MRYRCMYPVIHAPTDLRLDKQDAGEIGPGQVLVQAQLVFDDSSARQAQ